MTLEQVQALLDLLRDGYGKNLVGVLQDIEAELVKALEPAPEQTPA
jgi:hypothetical protein